MPHTIDIPKVGQVECPDGMSDDDIAKASHKLYTDQLDVEHKANLAAGERAEQNVRKVETAGSLIGGATRMAGMIGGPWGAAAVEPFAEGAEKAGRGESPYPTLSTVPRMALNAAIAKIPGGWLAKRAGIPAPVTALGRGAAGLAEGTLEGAGINTVSPMLEGRKPTLAGIASGAVTGGLVKGTLGMVPARAPKTPKGQSVQEMHTALGAKTAE